jgi:hypothetical protein
MNGNTRPREHSDQRIVRMNWAIENPRLRVALGKLRLKMANDAAMKLLRKNLGKPHLATAQRFIWK